MNDSLLKREAEGPSDFNSLKPQRKNLYYDFAYRYSEVTGLIALVVFGDFLFWGHRPGFTFALFAIAIFMCASMRLPDRTGAIRPAAFLGLAVLPVVEHVQLLSVCILAAGLLIALAWLHTLRKEGFDWLFVAIVRLIRSIPMSGTAATIARFKLLRDKSNPAGLFANAQAGTLWRNWAFPVGGTLVLGALLITANPILETLILKVSQIDLDVLKWIPRFMFWTGLGLLAWPLVNPPESLTTKALNLPNLNGGFGLNAESVLRALIVFNLCLAIQSGLDVSVLIGGAKLPDGLSYAAYAQRGAYSLIVTAMLAGAFSIAARPFLNARSFIKPMLYFWIVQNVVLTLSAILRLDMYIAEYGLTYLRMYALIWMGLVAAGLCLLLWQILRERSSIWLLARAAVLGAGTLYLCAFVNFAALVATDALSRAADAPQSRAVDWRYLCSLGPTAARAVARGLERHPAIGSPQYLRSCLVGDKQPASWREWDFRSARTQRYLADLSAM